jgi:hypothetical protein
VEKEDFEDRTSSNDDCGRAESASDPSGNDKGYVVIWTLHLCRPNSTQGRPDQAPEDARAPTDTVRQWYPDEWTGGESSDGGTDLSIKLAATRYV